MKISQAINRVINDYGVRILDDSRRFQAFVKDYVTVKDREDEYNIFKTLCNVGFLRYAIELSSIHNDEEVKFFCEKIKTKLMNESCLQETRAIEGINIFLEGLGHKYQVPLPNKKTPKCCAEGNELLLRKQEKKNI